MKNIHRVFVYGTLKRGIHNHYLLKDSAFVGCAYTTDTFKMYNVGFPIIRFAEQGHSVYGEVYDVDEATLKKLDGLENEGVMYDRKQINVILDNQHHSAQIIDANVFVYVGNDKYWDAHSPQHYANVNEHGELEWHP